MVVDYNAHKKGIEALLEHTATVTTLTQIEDPEKHISRPIKEIIYSKVQCRLSFINQTTTQVGNVAETTVVAKLFTLPNIEIPPGSIVTVNQYGRSKEYRATTEAYFYKSHCEYVLTHRKEPL